MSTLRGDRFGGEWLREQFRKHGMSYEPAEQPKSALYQNMLPLINSRRIDLLDHPRLLAQLVGLERRTARSGRDSIDHAPNAHDDVANCVAGLCAVAIKPGYDIHSGWLDLPAAAETAGGVHYVDLAVSPSIGPPLPRQWRSPYWQ